MYTCKSQAHYLGALATVGGYGVCGKTTKKKLPTASSPAVWVAGEGNIDSDLRTVYQRPRRALLPCPPLAVPSGRESREGREGTLASLVWELGT